MSLPNTNPLHEGSSAEPSEAKYVADEVVRTGGCLSPTPATDTPTVGPSSQAVTPPGACGAASASKPPGLALPNSLYGLDDEDENGAPEPPSIPFFSATCLKAAIPVVLTAGLYGYNIGLVGPYSTIYEYATNCQLYGAQTPCETLSAAKCQWMDSATVNASSTLGMVCGWQAPKTTCFLSYDDEASCGADSNCKWSYTAGTCGNSVGYTSILSGLFAGSMIIGATLGALLGGILTKWLDYRKSFLIIGIVSLVGAILTHVATGVFEYWLLFAARIVVGFPMGWQSVASPHYTDKFAPVEHAKTLGSFFQCSLSFFIFIASVFGVCLGLTIGYDTESDAQLMGRMQGLVCPATLLSVLVLFLPLVTRDGYSMPKATRYEDADAPGTAPAGAKKTTYSFAQMIGPILNGVAMASISQLTGVNANMNFAPKIMSNLGLEALVGNIIVMAWNALATFFVVPLSRKFSMRTLFLFCGFVGSLCCLFLSGIPVYPGVTPSKQAVNGIAIAGIAIFIALYEMGVGPCFYVLAVDVFPESFRPIGSSITVAAMMAFNLIINICYPIATEGMSGGPSGDQNKGQAIAFIFFGCIGTVCVVIEYFFLYPWEDDEMDEAGIQFLGGSTELTRT